MHNILVIHGSSRPNNNGQRVTAWLKEALPNQSTMDFTFIDIVDLELPFFVEAEFPATGKYAHGFTKGWSKLVAAADGYVVVMAEYNRGVPALMKNAFDYLYNEWNNKPIAFVGYSTSGALRAVEHMRLTAIELQMAPIREQVSIPIWQHVDNKGNFSPGPEVEKQLTKTLSQLEWWARVLADARQS